MKLIALKLLSKYFCVVAILLSLSTDANASFESDTSLINSWNRKSSLTFAIDKDGALLFADPAIRLSQKVNYQEGLGFGLIYKGLAHYYAGEFDWALKLMTRIPKLQPKTLTSC